MTNEHDSLQKLACEYIAEAKEIYYENEYKEALSLVENAVRIFENISDYSGFCESCNIAGVIYSSMGNETLAVDYYLRGIREALDHNVITVLAILYNNLGSVFQEMGQHEEALEYFELALETMSKFSEEEKQMERYPLYCLIRYINIAYSSKMLGDIERAWNAIETAKNYVSDSINRAYVFSYHLIRAEVLWDRGEEAAAKELVEQLVVDAKEDPSIFVSNDDPRIIGRLLEKMEDYEKWESFLSTYEIYCKKQDASFFDLILNELLLQYHKKRGNTERYRDLAVEHVELTHKRQLEISKIRLTAIKIKLELERKNRQIVDEQELLMKDVLTQIGNRYALQKDGETKIREAIDTGAAVGVGIIDIDCFKVLNDTYGHLKGDEGLFEIAQILKESVGNLGEVYRYGGDEFVMLLPGATASVIEDLGQRIKLQLKEKQIINENSSVDKYLTVSQGYVVSTPKESASVEDFIEKADQALYRVKQSGKNNYICEME